MVKYFVQTKFPYKIRHTCVRFFVRTKFPHKIPDTCVRDFVRDFLIQNSSHMCEGFLVRKYLTNLQISPYKTPYKIPLTCVKDFVRDFLIQNSSHMCERFCTKNLNFVRCFVNKYYSLGFWLDCFIYWKILGIGFSIFFWWIETNFKQNIHQFFYF